VNNNPPAGSDPTGLFGQVIVCGEVGAELGSCVCPGLGTAIGCGIGAVIGIIVGVIAAEECIPKKCNLINQFDQEPVGDPYDLPDGRYLPAMKVCVYRCPRRGIVRQYYPYGSPCKTQIDERG
jgi:hypothetical protein